MTTKIILTMLLVLQLQLIFFQSTIIFAQSPRKEISPTERRLHWQKNSTPRSLGFSRNRVFPYYPAGEGGEKIEPLQEGNDAEKDLNTIPIWPSPWQMPEDVEKGWKNRIFPKFDPHLNRFPLEVNTLSEPLGNHTYGANKSRGSASNSFYRHKEIFSDSAQIDWVNHYTSRLLSSDDVATAITVDDMGNVYVTGYSLNLPYGYDCFTIKYDAAGIEQWQIHYDFGGDDIPCDIATDATGHIYITGKSWNLVNSYDYVTIKYDATGTEQWICRYNGPGNGWDEPVALELDGSGNVYVTGFSWSSAGNYDYLTLKYNSAGVLQWSASYNGPGNGDDQTTALAVDNLGNVYVTGRGADSNNLYDYTTIKYNNEGIEQWVVHYHGLGNGNDWATDLVVDDFGNVNVTGNSLNSAGDYDFTTIQYNTVGIEQWVAHYNGPGNDWDRALALAVDNSGDVYVTGFSMGIGTGLDYTTVKYNTAGAEQWVSRYNGPGNNEDVAIDLLVGGSGDVYVTGYSAGFGGYFDYTTVKYNSSGEEQWIARYDSSGSGNEWANAMALDNAGNVYVTGYSKSSSTYDSDYATVKYDALGDEKWVIRFNGLGRSDDVATAMAVDNSGNVYVTGYSLNSETAYDYATVKYDAHGVEQWVIRYNGPGNGPDFASAIVVSNSGNVYVAGTSYRSGSSYDYTIINYNSEGLEQWIAYYNGPGNGIDRVTDLVVDDFENVYVTGNSLNSAGNYDYTTVKYNITGNEQWVARYDGPGNDCDQAHALAVDDSGHVYVTGYSLGSYGNYDYATVKYNTTGNEQWVRRYNGSLNSLDAAIDIAVDNFGNVHVTGASRESESTPDYTTIKYNASGVEQWVVHYNGSGNHYDEPFALALDNSGNVYVTGFSGGIGTGPDYATVKYDAAGIEQWVARYDGPGNDWDFARSLALDNSGNVYVTGYSSTPSSGLDNVTLKYNASGEEQWVMRYNGPGGINDEACSLVVDELGNVYISGSSYTSFWSVYTTIKYTQTPVNISVSSTNLPKEYNLMQNYPNPFNPETVIGYQLPVATHVKLTIYNLIGQKVRTIVRAQHPAGRYEVKWDGRDENGAQVSGGIYFYQLHAGDFRQASKMVLLR